MKLQEFQNRQRSEGYECINEYWYIPDGESDYRVMLTFQHPTKAPLLAMRDKPTGPFSKWECIGIEG